MSRSGYDEDSECTNESRWATIRWRGAVASAIRGRRGQEFLRETLAALDAMPEKSLTKSRFEADGECCTLGAVCRVRGVDASALTPDNDPIYADDVSGDIAGLLGISKALAAEVMWLNDESIDDQRWTLPPSLVPSDSPYWERGRQKEIRIGVESVGEKRWRYMRDWVAGQIKETARRAGVSGAEGLRRAGHDA